MRLPQPAQQRAMRRRRVLPVGVLSSEEKARTGGARELIIVGACAWASIV